MNEPEPAARRQRGAWRPAAAELVAAAVVLGVGAHLAWTTPGALGPAAAAPSAGPAAAAFAGQGRNVPYGGGESAPSQAADGAMGGAKDGAKGGAEVAATMLQPPAREGGPGVARSARPEPPPAPLPGAARRVRGAHEDQSADLSDYANPGEQPTMAEVIARLHQAGIRSGLGAFQPPGTRPPLVGLAVPEDFALPEGYVRHYQATDDGQRIEPILMFSPDRPRLDATGRPLLGREERVVPPEAAPAGLPIRRVAIPPSEPTRQAPGLR